MGSPDFIHGSPCLIDPLLRLPVLGIIDFLGRIEGRVEILKQAPTLLGLAIDQNLVTARVPTSNSEQVCIQSQT